MEQYEILTPQLVDSIESGEADEPWLFLEASEDFRGCWTVDGLSNGFFFDFEDIIGPHCLLTPISLGLFLDTARELEYRPIFIEDPVLILDAYKHLTEEPVVKLTSGMDNTVNGFLPWQVVGFNKLIKDEEIQGGYVVWDTGAGKSAFIAAGIEYHRTVGHPFNLAMVVVKSHNKIDTQRKLLRMIGVNAVVIDGPIDKRYKIYEEIEMDLIAGKQVIAITNYEKFREDEGVFKLLFKKRDCLFFWDEMPTKLSNLDTRLYKAVKSTLYQSFYSKPRPSWMRHWALTATPVENSPADVYGCVNILWPGLLGSLGSFGSTYVAGRNAFSGKPSHWKNLDLLEAKLTFMTHRVSKDDPEVADMFPEVILKPVTIDWNPKHRTIYDKLTGKAKDLIEELDDANILAMIQIMQMICDAPSMVKESAAHREAFLELLSRLEDENEALHQLRGPIGSDVARALLTAIPMASLNDVGHTKLEMWKEIITQRHPDSKILTFSTWADYIFPVWTYWLDQWGVKYVVFNGTGKQKQEALDRFRNDPEIRVFLSGDAGADSIDIPQANVVVNYNIPWKWTTLKQRVGRADRVDSGFDSIYRYDLIMPDSIDERKVAITDRKHEYHAMLFDGQAQDEAFSATMTREDLLYLLLGD